MKINPIGMVVIVVVICAAAYYLYHHQINASLDIKGDNGSKSHMSIKHDQSSKPKHDKHDNNA